MKVGIGMKSDVLEIDILRENGLIVHSLQRAGNWLLISSGQSSRGLDFADGRNGHPGQSSALQGLEVGINLIGQSLCVAAIFLLFRVRQRSLTFGRPGRPR